MPVDLDDLHDELRRGHIWECSLRDPRWHLDGLREGDNIYIDPRPAILETVLHELLHRRKPRWGERRVTSEARRLLAQMKNGEMATWWRAYQQLKRKGRPVEIEDE